MTAAAPETPAAPGQAAEIPAAFGGWVRMQFPREIELPKNEIAGRWKYMTGPAEREFWREVETALAAQQPALATVDLHRWYAVITQPNGMTKVIGHTSDGLGYYDSVDEWEAKNS